MKNAALLRQAARMPIEMDDWFTDDAKCGTIGCLAGNLCLIDGWVPDLDVGWGAACKNGETEEADVIASRILGLELSETSTLFYVTDWPLSFSCDLSEAGEADCPVIIQDRVEAFMAEHGGDL